MTRFNNCFEMNTDDREGFPYAFLSPAAISARLKEDECDLCVDDSHSDFARHVVESLSAAYLPPYIELGLSTYVARDDVSVAYRYEDSAVVLYTNANSETFIIHATGTREHLDLILEKLGIRVTATSPLTVNASFVIDGFVKEFHMEMTDDYGKGVAWFDESEKVYDAPAIYRSLLPTLAGLTLKDFNADPPRDLTSDEALEVLKDLLSCPAEQRALSSLSAGAQFAMAGLLKSMHETIAQTKISLEWHVANCTNTIEKGAKFVDRS